MKKKLFFGGIAAALLILYSCSSQYQITNVNRSRILIDDTYDAAQDQNIIAFMQPFKQKVDSIMGPVVGRTAKYMAAERPESTLSNLLADILVWSGRLYNEQPVFAVYNMGGMRAALAQGDITYGDVLDVAPFENKICFVNLHGDKVLELFRQIASVGGEAVSHGVEIVIGKDGSLVSAQLNGKEIDTDADYRVATIDYVAQGNDKLEAFKSSTNINSPESEENNVRYIIVKYMQEKTTQGQIVDAEIEGRIKYDNK
ncbi:MAG: 5'-nucleotidase C-terminal domain-containing protein [Prevotella sp.]|nr:5'-nucleotidase C-terminal domain-containing protein [Prevotella sp.]